MSAALETVRSFEAAWQAGDFEKARGYLADDVVFDSPFGRETTAEAVIGQYAGFSQVLTGSTRELAAFGDGEGALLMYELPTSVFGTQVCASRYVVREGRIAAETLVYDATQAKAMIEAGRPA